MGKQSEQTITGMQDQQELEARLARTVNGWWQARGYVAGARVERGRVRSDLVDGLPAGYAGTLT